MYNNSIFQNFAKLFIIHIKCWTLYLLSSRLYFIKFSVFSPLEWFTHKIMYMFYLLSKMGEKNRFSISILHWMFPQNQLPTTFPWIQGRRRRMNLLFIYLFIFGYQMWIYIKYIYKWWDYLVIVKLANCVTIWVFGTYLRQASWPRSYYWFMISVARVTHEFQWTKKCIRKCCGWSYRIHDNLLFRM